MRTILFRGKRVDNNQWVYGGYHLHDEVMLCIASDEQRIANRKHVIVCDGMSDWNLSVPINCYEVYPESVGQFTGFTDKNEERIFEGDILKQEHGEINEVSYSGGRFMPICEETGCGCCSENISPERSEIIGNIYENPELCKS